MGTCPAPRSWNPAPALPVPNAGEEALLCDPHLRLEQKSKL